MTSLDYPSPDNRRDRPDWLLEATEREQDTRQEQRREREHERILYGDGNE